MHDFSGVYMFLTICAVYIAPNLTPESRRRLSTIYLVAAIILAVLVTTKEFFK